MSDITLSKAVRSNLLSLKGTADMMAVAQNRLSTGNKVNSALDNPSNWFTAKGLTNRSSDLNALMDSMANGIQTLKAADNGLSAMTKTLESMQSTLRQARQDKTFQTASFSIDETAVGVATAKNITIGGGAVGTTPVDISLNTVEVGGSLSAAAGTGAYAAPTAAAVPTYTAQNAYGTPAGGEALTIDLGDSSVDVTLTATENTIGLAIAKINAAITADSDSVGKIEAYDNGGKLAIRATGSADGTISVSGAGKPNVFGTQVTVGGSDGKTSFTVNGNAVVLDTTTGVDIATAVDTANTQLKDTGFETFNDGGKMSVRATKKGMTAITIAGADAALFNTTVLGTAPTTEGKIKTVDALVKEINENADLKGNIRASNDNGKLRIENLSTQKLDITGVNSDAKVDGSNGKHEVTGNSVRAGLAAQFNELRDQLDKLADDASFNGINLMRGDKLTITFNETGTSSIDIQTKNSQTINSANLGVPTSLEEKQLDNDTDIDSLLTDMKSALDSVRSQASTFGSNLSIVQNRQEFTKAMIDTLETGAGNLTLADMNEEAANLLALQTRQQLSSNSLSLASQADQSILQLLR